MSAPDTVDLGVTSVSDSDVSIVTCSCGLPAQLRVSQTSKNPTRLFYNCPKDFEIQCGFFRWSNELAVIGDRNVDELNLMRYNCNQLQEKLEKVQRDRLNERRVWQRKKNHLKAKLSSVQRELADLKKSIKILNESDLMPPLDRPSIVDDRGEDAKVIHAI